MEKLNELAEQAKFSADWHGSDWSSALCQKKDGKQAHEIICESRGEAVISTGSNSNEASWLCDYLELCSPENILTIAEAFRDLEQRAEAAEAKLAELDKQRNPDYFLNRIESSDKWGPEVELRIYESQLDASKSQDDHGGGIIELFTRPAPAADLVQGEWTNEQCLEFLSIAFRHAEISGDIKMDDIRLAVKMVNEGAGNN